MSEEKGCHDARRKVQCDSVASRREPMRKFVPNVGCDPGHVDVVQRCVDLILQANDDKKTQTHREENE